MLARTILALGLLHFAAAKPVFEVPGSPSQVLERDFPTLDTKGGAYASNNARDVTGRSEENQLAKRRGPNGCDSDCISSCGNGPWMPIGFPSGFNNTIVKFCNWAAVGPGGGVNIIPPGGLLNNAQDGVDVENGQVPSGQKSPTINAGWLDLEINNKQKTSYTVVAGDCIKNLGNLVASNSPCYGSGNGDTLGGTYQVGRNSITFHAIPHYGSA